MQTTENISFAKIFAIQTQYVLLEVIRCCGKYGIFKIKNVAYEICRLLNGQLQSTLIVNSTIFLIDLSILDS